MKESDRYLKIVEWSEEDRCYVGTCPGLMLGGVHGDNEAMVYGELCQAVEEWIELCRKDGTPLPAGTAGKKYSGQFVVRVGSELHKTLAVAALRHGESLNSHCVHLLREEPATYGGRKRTKRPGANARGKRLSG
jgi:predicted HicB family RNase H-like nuclease